MDDAASADYPDSSTLHNQHAAAGALFQYCRVPALTAAANVALPVWIDRHGSPEWYRPEAYLRYVHPYRRLPRPIGLPLPWKDLKGVALLFASDAGVKSRLFMNRRDCASQRE